MYGAIIGDIVGSKYEFNNIKTKEFPLFSAGCDFTDDTIMTVAVAKAILLRRDDLFRKKETGELLAKMHTISERNHLHVKNPVLFDPFSSNDLFAYEDFKALGDSLEGKSKQLYEQIVERYTAYMDILSPLKESPRYAVQGDISDCNLFLTPSGEIGIFDFNRCGDNRLFCDAAMQAVFEARLMIYPENITDDFKSEVFAAFWDGYRSIRPVSEQEQPLYPYLYAIIDAFWSQDILWREDSLINAHKAGDADGVQKWLSLIWERLSSPQIFI